MLVLQRSKQLPSIPKKFVRPTIVAGINSLGRGQDQETLIRFITTISQTMGPESIQKFIDPTEYIKRLAAAQGIDYLNLIKSPETLQQDMQKQQQMAQQQSLTDQAGQLASAPMMDPSKNPELSGDNQDGSAPEGQASGEETGDSTGQAPAG